MCNTCSGYGLSLDEKAPVSESELDYTKTVPCPECNASGNPRNILLNKSGWRRLDEIDNPRNWTCDNCSDCGDPSCCGVELFAQVSSDGLNGGEDIETVMCYRCLKKEGIVC